MVLTSCSGTGHPASAAVTNQAGTKTTVTIASCGPSCSTPPRVLTLSSGSGPAKKYDCAFNVATSAFTGAFGTASAIGWEGNDQGVVTCLGGTFYVQDGIADRREKPLKSAVGNLE